MVALGRLECNYKQGDYDTTESGVMRSHLFVIDKQVKSAIC